MRGERVRYVSRRRRRDADHPVRRNTRNLGWLLLACHGVFGGARDANRVAGFARYCVRPLGVSHVRWCKRGLV